MSENVMEVMRRTFPKSVQPGLPKLKPPKPGWKSCRFGELLDQVQRRVHLQPDDTYDLVTVKRSRGGIESRGKLRGSQISVTSQFRIAAGDFLISKRQIVHGACGAVSSEFDGAVVSNEYSVLRCKPNIDLTFLQYLSHSVYFQQTCFHSSIGVHIEKMIFKLDEWFKWPVNIPTLPEQKKIAAFLGAVDAKLAALAAKQAALGRFKAGLMQKLFTQQLRFTRDEGRGFPDWEEKELRAVSTINPKSPNLPKRFRYIDLESVNAGTLGAVREIDATEAPSRAQRVLQRGDILYQTVRPYQRNNFYFDLDGIYVGSTGYAQIRAKQNRHYLFHALHTEEFVNRVIERCTGTGYPAINSSDLGGITLPIPHPVEQQKIATALCAMDAKIQAVADQVAKLQTFKKGLLQQMFV